jgi:hypothetical protein
MKSEECDGDCLSCDVDTYISCEKRISPKKEPKWAKRGTASRIVPGRFK